MACIANKRELKNGMRAYDVQFYINGKFEYKTIKTPKEMGKRDADRFVEKEMSRLEYRFREDSKPIEYNPTFTEYSNKWLNKCRNKRALTYFVRCGKILEEINARIGNKLLRALVPTDFANILDSLDNKQIIDEKAILKKQLEKPLKAKRIVNVCRECGLSETIFHYIRRSMPIEWKNAEKIARSLGVDVNEYFRKEVKTRHYTKETKLKYKRTINAVLNAALEEELIDRNPAKKVFKTQNITGGATRRESLSLEESLKLEKAIEQEAHIRIKASAALMFYAALRVGEIAGLEWKDIDLDTSELNIKRSVGYVNSEFGIIEKAPKTESSNRSIIVPKKLISILREYKIWYDKEKQRLGSYWIDKDKVIIRPNGEWITPSVMSKWLKDMQNRNNLKSVSPHTLRHTNITMQIRNGISPKAVAAFVGHSTPDITLRIYTHAIKEDKALAAKLFDNLEKEMKANDVI